MVGGRWVRDQKADIVKLTDGVYKVSWTEPTGTDVSLNFMPKENKLHGVIFFPKWVHEHPEITVCYQNDHIPLMEESREKYETYPKYVVPEFGEIFYQKNEGANNEKVISQAPYDGMVDDIVNGKLTFTEDKKFSLANFFTMKVFPHWRTPFTTSGFLSEDFFHSDIYDSIFLPSILSLISICKDTLFRAKKQESHTLF